MDTFLDWTTATLIMEKGLRQLGRLRWRWCVGISGELFCSWGTRRWGVLTFPIVNVWSCFASDKERQVVKVLSLLLIDRIHVHCQTSESMQHKHAEKRNDYIHSLQSKTVSQYENVNLVPNYLCYFPSGTERTDHSDYTPFNIEGTFSFESWWVFTYIGLCRIFFCNFTVMEHYLY